MFFSKHKTVFYVIISLVLVFLLFSIISYTAKSNTDMTYSVTSELFYNSQKSGYTVVTDDMTGKTVYTAENNDPWTCVVFPEEINADYILINFEEAVNPDIDIVLYYSLHGEPFNPHWAYAHTDIIDRSMTLVTIPVTNLTCRAMRFDIDSSFSIKSIDFYNVEILSMPSYRFNFTAFALLLVCIFVLVLLEKKFGYFHAIRDVIRGTVKNTVDMLLEKHYAKALLNIFRWTSNIVLSIAICLAFWFNRLSTSGITALFVIFSTTIILNVTYKIIAQSFASPARLFFITALLIGLMFSICLPITTYNVPDEEIHYGLALELKSYLFDTDKSLADLKMQWRHYYNYNYILSPDSLIDDIVLDDSIHFDMYRQNSNVYNRIGYLPAVITMIICELIGTSFVQKFIFAKIAPLLIFVFLTTLGIRRLRSGGYIISAICLVPSMMILASSYSYDCWVMAFITFGITYFISELQRQDKKLTVYDCIIMIGSIFIGCGPKAVYFILMLPLLFINKGKFASRKFRIWYIIACILTMIIILLSFALPFLVNTGEASDYRGGSSVNATEQLKFILTEPFAYAKIVFEFISDYLSFENMSTHIVSHTYFEVPLTVYATILIFVLMFAVFTDKSQCDRFEGRHIVRSVGILACIGTTLLVITALYISFTPVRHTTINGVQYRYVFPIMPIFFYSLGSARVQSTIDKRVSETMVYGMSALVAICVFYEFYISLFLSSTV